MENENKPLYSSKEEVLNRAQMLANGDTPCDRQEMDLLKSLYYKLHGRHLLTEEEKQMPSYRRWIHLNLHSVKQCRHSDRNALWKCRSRNRNV